MSDHWMDVAWGRYDALQRVRDLHTPSPGQDPVCQECGHPWPCHTIRAMDGTP